MMIVFPLFIFLVAQYFCPDSSDYRSRLKASLPGISCEIPVSKRDPVRGVVHKYKNCFKNGIEVLIGSHRPYPKFPFHYYRNNWNLTPKYLKNNVFNYNTNPFSWKVRDCQEGPRTYSSRACTIWVLYP